jgi:hypothetical protein
MLPVPEAGYRVELFLLYLIWEVSRHHTQNDLNVPIYVIRSDILDIYIVKLSQFLFDRTSLCSELPSRADVLTCSLM